MTSHLTVYISGLSSATTLNIQRREQQPVTTIALPVFHTAALNMIVIPFLQMGRRVHLLSGFDPEVFRGPWLRHGARAGKSLPVPARHRFPHADLVMASGMTEATPGTLCQWPAIMEGYLRPDNSVFAGGWLHSGYVGNIDADGAFSFTDRLKDIVKSGGENISSVIVEQVVLDHPEVLEAAVIGVPDEDWGERVTAVVVPANGAPELIPPAKRRVVCRGTATHRIRQDSRSEQANPRGSASPLPR